MLSRFAALGAGVDRLAVRLQGLAALFSVSLLSAQARTEGLLGLILTLSLTLSLTPNP